MDINLRPIEVSIIFKAYRGGKEVKHDRFKKACCEKLDKEFFEYLTSGDIQVFFSNLERHRDVISHKGKIHIMMHDNRDKGTFSVLKPTDPYFFRTKKLNSKPGEKRNFELCSQFADYVITNLDILFVRINDSVLKHIKKDRI